MLLGRHQHKSYTLENVSFNKNGFLNDIDQSIDNEILKKINCPTLIVHSKNDNSVSFDHALNTNKMISGSELLALNNEWGHLFWIGSDSKEAITKTLDFINNKSGSIHKYVPPQ